jgi:hypothetical protein
VVKSLRAAGVLAAFAVLAIVHTYPLIRMLGTALPGLGLGDNVTFLWNAWWMREAIASPARTYFFTDALFAPLGASLVLHTHTAASALIESTLLAPWSLPAAVNVMTLATLTLNGWAVYLLARSLGASVVAAWVGGALFLVAPTVTLRLMGHANLVAVWPLTLSCLAWIAWLRQPGPARGVGLAFIAAVLAYSDYYYLTYFALFALAYGVLFAGDIQWSVRPRPAGRLTRVLFGAAIVAAALALVVIVFAPFGIDVVVPPFGIDTRISVRSATNIVTAWWLVTLIALMTKWRPRLAYVSRVPLRPLLARTAGPVLLALLLVAPLGVGAVRLWRAGDYVTQRSSLKSSANGVDVATLVLGPSFSGAAGRQVRSLYEHLGIDVMEQSAWVGLVLPIWLIALGRRRPPDPEERRWLAMAGVFGVWALGPYLTVLGHETGILLPQAIAHFVPVINNARIPGRAMVMVSCALCLLLALRLSRQPARRTAGVSGLLLILAIGESIAAPLPTIALPPTDSYAAIANDRTNLAVLSIPFGMRDGFGEYGRLEHEALYAQTVHRHPIAGGFIARLAPRTLDWYRHTEPFATLMATPVDGTPSLPPCAVNADGFRAASIGFVVIYRRDVPPGAADRLVASLPVARVADDGERLVLKVRPDGCAG